MAFWLFKVEPSCYGYADLERDGSTVWDGVANPLARKHLAAVRAGDGILYYHTGNEKAVVGTARATSDARAAGGPVGKEVEVTVEPVRRFAAPVPLSAIKADVAFAGWELILLPRLSVVPANEECWRRIVEWGRD